MGAKAGEMRKDSDQRRKGPEPHQVAGLCFRKGKDGKRELLLITSRDTGRWIIPKGWVMEDKSNPNAARQEAWEEAGVVKAKVKKKPLGTYEYPKVLDNGQKELCVVEVYPIRVSELAKKFPEADERKRKWVSCEEAVNMVDEPELREIIRRNF